MSATLNLPVSARPTRRRGWRVAVELAIAVPILSAMVVIGLVAPLVFPEPNAIALDHRLEPPSWVSSEGTTLLGTDPVGRSVLARIAHGARVSLTIALLSVAIAGAVGSAIGTIAGFLRGRFDMFAMGLVDIQLSLPFMLIAIFLAAVMGANTRNTVVVLVIVGWAMYARILRGEVLQLREVDFVEAARAAGASDWRIIRRAILPNVLGTAAVVASIAVPRMILAEASLSFVGLGVQPPTPSWGAMIAESRNYLNVAWWTAFFPGMAITLTVLSVNMLGYWLRDRLDPRTSSRWGREGG